MPDREVFSAQDSPDIFLRKAKLAVIEAYDQMRPPSDSTEVTPDDLYIVWFSKVLQNWKALVSSHILGDLYFEVTRNGTSRSTYVDIYTKRQNVRILDATITEAYNKEYNA